MGSIRPDSRVVTEKGVAFYRRSCPNSGIVATVFCCELESARSKAAYTHFSVTSWVHQQACSLLAVKSFAYN